MQACNSHTVPRYNITCSHNRTPYNVLDPLATRCLDKRLPIRSQDETLNFQSLKRYPRPPNSVTNLKRKAPTRSTSEAAGYDFYSSEDIKVPPRTRILVSTDIAIQIPPATYGKIAPRSGLSVKNCIDIGAGVIDKDYRGQIKILLINHSDTEFLVQQGDRIAQLILEQITTPDTKTVQSLQSTERGSKGFRSTGISSKPIHGERLFFKAKLKIGGRYIQARLPGDGTPP